MPLCVRVCIWKDENKSEGKMINLTLLFRFSLKLHIIQKIHN